MLTLRVQKSILLKCGAVYQQIVHLRFESNNTNPSLLKMKYTNYTLIIIWLVASSCNRTAHVYFPEIKKNSNLEIAHSNFSILKIKYLSSIIPIADNLKINKSTKTPSKPPQILQDNLNAIMAKVNEPPKYNNLSFRLENTGSKTNLIKSLNHASPRVNQNVPASPIIKKFNAQVLSVPHKNLITSLLSFCFGVLAILFVIPLYASGFIGGLIIIPLAAIIAITLGFIGLRKNPKKGTILLIAGIVMGFISLASLMPLLLFFLAYI